MKHFILAITGASGAAYAQRVLEGLLAAGARVHLIVSPQGARLWRDELGRAVPAARGRRGRDEPGLTVHDYEDVGAELASGSFSAAGMAVVPCSANTLGQIAGGLADNLIGRAAAVMLKERRRLVLVYREMPMNRIDLENALKADAAGAIFCPACPGFYLRPQRVADVVDMVAGKVLDLLGVEHGLKTRWAPGKRQKVKTPKRQNTERE